MCADSKLRLAAKDPAASLSLCSIVERSGQQRNAIGLACPRRNRIAQQLPREEIVLCRKNFRRNHHRDLEAVLNRDKGGLHGDDGLTGADIPLQKTTHRLRSPHVGDDLSQHALLRGSGMERENLFDRRADRVVRREGCTNTLAKLPALKFKAKLEIEKLLKDKPPVGWC